ncbi:tetratricopeptide repeat protein [bacterium]|nr:tetratricopeptide repeat protein [bacterium]
MDIREIIRASEYYKMYQNIETVAHSELPNIQVMFPYYTDHGIPHCDKLFELIGEILPDDLEPKLTELEEFLLCGAVLLHDIGMVPKDNERPNRALQRKIRENHHHRCKEYILENYCKLGLEHKHAEIIADIAFAHRGRDAKDISEYLAERIVGIGAKGRVRMQLLSALLRIADECHVTYDRIESLMGHEKELDSESQKHFLKHLSTEGISCSPKGEVLEISAIITKNEIREILEGVRKKIEYELAGVQSIFRRYGIGIRAVRIYLQESESLQIETQGVVQTFVMNTLKSGSLRISDFMKEAKIGSAGFQHLLDILKEQEIIVERKDDSASLELDSDNLIAVSRMFLNSQMKLDFLRLDAVQQSIEKTAASIIRERFYIETDETTLHRILGFAKRLPSVLRFLLVSDNSYYANVFKYSNHYAKLNLSNLTHSRFISEILTATLKDLQTIDTNDIKEIDEYTSTIKVSITFKDHTRFALASSATIALLKLAEGSEPIEAGQPVKAADISTEVRSANSKFANGYFIEAKKSYEVILEKDPTCIPAINNLGLVYKELGHHEQAIALFDKIINELDPELPEVYFNKGTSLASLGRTGEAIENYEIAIKKNPDYSNAWYWKGVALFERGDFAGAKNCFERVIQLSAPSEACLYLSKCLFALGDQQGAMSNVDRAIKVDSTNIQARFWKIELLYRSDNREGALAELSELAKICYEWMAHHRESKKTCDDATNAYLATVDMRANILIEMGNYKECNNFLNRILFQIPEHATGWYNKACALAYLKMKKEMLESLKKSIHREPSFKMKGKEDKDFQDYWCDDEFNVIVQD